MLGLTRARKEVLLTYALNEVLYKFYLTFPPKGGVLKILPTKGLHLEGFVSEEAP